MQFSANFFPRHIMSLRNSTYFVFVILIAILETTPEINAQKTETFANGDSRGSTFEPRDAAIRDALVAISTGKFPPDDDRLINLMAEKVREAGINANDPSAGIEAAAREAQEAVSEVTAAYTAIIFQSSSVKEAQRLFNRFQDTVNKIVEFSKSGNFVVRYNHPK